MKMRYRLAWISAP